MESIKQWFQDWSDACEYANECAPDFSTFPLGNGEPYTAIAAIAAVCFFVWAINERRLKGRRAAEPVAAAPEGLKAVAEKMKREPSSAEKLAA